MKVLTRGRKQLWHSYYSIPILRYILNPFRDIVLDPLFAIATIVLPSLVLYNYSKYPMIDQIVAQWCSFNIYIMQCFYRPIPIQSHMNLRSIAKQDFMITTKAAYHIPTYHPPSDLVSSVRGALAFTISMTADIISLLIDTTKMTKWMETLTELKSYLDVSGVATELEESIVKPLYAGRLLDNLKLLSDIQGLILYTNRHFHIATIISSSSSARTSTSTSTPTPTPTTTTTDQQQEQEQIYLLQDSIRIGHRMMRFATSAYGTEMIKSALDREVSVRDLMMIDTDTDTDTDNNDSNNAEQVKKAIAFHSGISNVQDIRIVEVQDGGDMHLLRHFVAIDHISQSVILAIRGTLSVSGALVDVTAMDVDYCGGRAHKGMSEMANNIWNRSGDKILSIFNDNPNDKETLQNYSFTIVGHSLGAGVACLLQIKCYTEELLGPNRVVKCYGFAPPPTFCMIPTATTTTTSKQKEGEDDTVVGSVLHDKKIQAAIENTICYVHDNDCVPLLSIQSIRRLALLMDTVDNYTEHIWFYERFQMFWNWKTIPQNIIDAVTKVDIETTTTITTAMNSTTTDDTTSISTTTTTDEAISTTTTNYHDTTDEATGTSTNDTTRTSATTTVASNLIIPAKMIVWMKKVVVDDPFVVDVVDVQQNNKNNINSNNKYIAVGCPPESFAKMNIYFCQDMITDHLVEPYEDSLDALLKEFE